MKRNLIFVMILMLMSSLAAYGGGRRQIPSGPSVDLVVFAAASMTNTLEEIAILYRTVAPKVRLVFNFDSSGTLRTQIMEGAHSDLFISAAPLQMNQLEEAGFLLQGSRLDLLENRVTLCVPSGNPAGITGFSNLANRLRNNENILLAMGNRDVPVGQYTQLILTHFGLNETTLANNGRLTYGSNVREVATHVLEASVSAGVVYETHAFSVGLQIVDFATAEMCGQVIYPAAVLNITRHVDEAKAFLTYLQTPAATAVFESVGFAPIRR